MPRTESIASLRDKLHSIGLNMLKLESNKTAKHYNNADTNNINVSLINCSIEDNNTNKKDTLKDIENKQQMNGKFLTGLDENNNNYKSINTNDDKSNNKNSNVDSALKLTETDQRNGSSNRDSYIGENNSLRRGSFRLLKENLMKISPYRSIYNDEDPQYNTQALNVLPNLTSAPSHINASENQNINKHPTPSTKSAWDKNGNESNITNNNSSNDNSDTSTNKNTNTIHNTGNNLNTSNTVDAHENEIKMSNGENKDTNGYNDQTLNQNLVFVGSSSMEEVSKNKNNNDINISELKYNYNTNNIYM